MSETKDVVRAVKAEARLEGSYQRSWSWSRASLSRALFKNLYLPHQENLGDFTVTLFVYFYCNEELLTLDQKQSRECCPKRQSP